MSTDEAAKAWLDAGEKCAASETVFTYCTGVDALSDWGEDCIRTVEDLRRVRLLLEACPSLRSCLPRCAPISPQWADTVNFWDDICLIHDLEDPDWRDRAGAARKTQGMINKILKRHASCDDDNLGHKP